MGGFTDAYFGFPLAVIGRRYRMPTPRAAAPPP